MSRGRVILGLGRGFRAPLFRAFGIDPKTKRDRFDACLDAMLEHWEQSSEGEASEGAAVPSGGCRIRAPWQTPHPPLAVAAFGPLGLAQAALDESVKYAQQRQTFGKPIAELL